MRFEAEGKVFEITRTIYSNSERSEHFLVTIFFTDSRRFFISTLDSRIDLGQEALPKRLNVGPWINIENRKFGKKNVRA